MINEMENEKSEYVQSSVERKKYLLNTIFLKFYFERSCPHV